MSKTKISKITATQVKGAVEWLRKEKCGCFHLPFFVDPETGREWCYVIGWHEIGDGPNEEWDREHCFVEDGFRIDCAIRYQECNNGMQCDLDWDWTIPSFKDGDCYDLSFAIGRGEKWGDIAKRFTQDARCMMRVIREAGDDMD